MSAAARKRTGRGQLSLVEHALCPLDSRVGLRPNLVHKCEHTYFDKHRNRRTARVRVDAPLGLSPSDEFYLWGLLALTLREPEPTFDFRATPHYCLVELGCPNPGGNEHRRFRAAIERLAAVTYHGDAFYDPVRAERCATTFGFLSYRRPLDSESRRAWRFAWDPVFFDFCRAAGGSLEFDLERYRRLDDAGRRLYLLLRKVFWRRTVSPTFDLRELATNVLGYSPTLATKHLRAKVAAVVGRLVAVGLVQRDENGPDGRKSITRVGPGRYRVILRPGPDFGLSAGRRSRVSIRESRFFGPLSSLGFDERSIGRIVGTYKPHLVDEWTDITLAARERFGERFFKRNPRAYLLDGLKHASTGTRGVPDWWHEVRREEQRREAVRDRTRRPGNRPKSARDEEFAKFLGGEGRAAFERVVSTVLDDLRRSGVDDDSARRIASDTALGHMRRRFRNRT